MAVQLSCTYVWVPTCSNARLSLEWMPVMPPGWVPQGPGATVQWPMHVQPGNQQLLPPPMQAAAVAATAGAVQGSATISAPAAAETLVGGTSQKQLQQHKQRASKKPR